MINPVYWLELRIRAREKRLWIIALFFVFSMLTISGVVFASSLLQSQWHMTNPAEIGNGLIWAILFCQAGLLIMLAPLATAGRISQEREQRTLPALVNSTVSALRVATGKLAGSWTFTLWLGLLVLPFLLTASLWGGPGAGMILLGMALNILAGLTMAAVSLGLSGLFGRSLTAYLVTGAFLFAWVVIVPLLGALAVALNQDGGETYQTLIAYLTWYHHPFFPLSSLVNTDWSLHAGETILHVCYAVLVWSTLTALGMSMAVRGLKREVY
jgi:ABC-type transport system involved in multi-copper enzyme maturation permease subunit